jgi:Dolichyl-phosphate-mannose-protein mannosyltransferase
MKRTYSDYWWVGLGLILVASVLLRLKGINDPIFDHPGWRQGDTASIARNFALLRYNVMYPQTMYNGPPPNYVELELQIVPFLAATAYKLFGVHEIFGRLISLSFSVGTVAVLAFFGRWLFAGSAAGLIAAAFYAVFPGSVYYGRTFMPDAAMVFFLTAALYAAARFALADAALAPRELARTTALLTFAYLAKPVAALAVVPVSALLWERVRMGRATRVSATAVLLGVPLLILALYDRRLASYAEWHWTSGITSLHVLPALRDSLLSVADFLEKLLLFKSVLGMLRATMLGTIGSSLSVVSFAVLAWVPSRSKTLLWAWLAAALAYAYVVVTVERVDYYLYPFLPLCALAIGGVLARYAAIVSELEAGVAARYALTAAIPVIVAVALAGGFAATSSYYRYNVSAYRNAAVLNRMLQPGALVVIGHYGPDVQYYLDRFGWEEDPELWTPFDEQSAIRKGARYFISVEDNRLRRNLDLCVWLARFPILDFGTPWPVYLTDPARTRSGADGFWKAFRSADRAGRGRDFADAHGVCLRRAAKIALPSDQRKRSQSVFERVGTDGDVAAKRIVQAKR